MNPLSFSSVQLDTLQAKHLDRQTKWDELSGIANEKSLPGAKSLPYKKLHQAAQEFESILLASLWRSMQDGPFALPGSSSGSARGALQEWGMMAVSSALAASGALGIAQLILRHLESTVTAGEEGSGAG